jgi:uncharacterized protein YbcI
MNNTNMVKMAKTKLGRFIISKKIEKAIRMITGDKAKVQLNELDIRENDFMTILNFDTKIEFGNFVITSNTTIKEIEAF